MDEVIVIQEHICFAWVCTSLKDDNEVNARMWPSGTRRGWTVADEETLRKQGIVSPQPCEQDTNRRHVLMVC